jgi:hypothetical protein
MTIDLKLQMSLYLKLIMDLRQHYLQMVVMRKKRHSTYRKLFIEINKLLVVKKGTAGIRDFTSRVDLTRHI